MDWALPGNRFHSGTFIGIKGDKLILKMKKDGKKAGLDLKQFTPAAQAYAKALNEAVKAEKLADKMPKLETETWTSSDGKPLNATFVSLDGDTLTVKTAAGKSYTFELTRLDESSQARAKEVAVEIAKALGEK